MVILAEKLDMFLSLLGHRAQIKIEAAQKDGDNVFTVLHSEYKWRKVRNRHIDIEPCCQMCDATKELEVHHIAPWHTAPELRYDFKNLVTLCRECHFRFGHWRNWSDCNPEILVLCKFAQQQRTRLKLGDRDEEERDDPVSDYSIMPAVRP